jgi:acyl-CoA synthetase (AMP-forming)/AMP-acid ligase II
LLLRGETVVTDYRNKPEAAASTLVDGWLHTGDVCRLDDDGYITLVDRLKVVIARPHPTECGESIVAVVILGEGANLDLEHLRHFAAARIARIKLPHDLVVDHSPRNPSGKVLKRQLRKSFAMPSTAVGR